MITIHHVKNLYRTRMFRLHYKYKRLEYVLESLLGTWLIASKKLTNMLRRMTLENIFVTFFYLPKIKMISLNNFSKVILFCNFNRNDFCISTCLSWGKKSLPRECQGMKIVSHTIFSKHISGKRSIILNNY